MSKETFRLDILITLCESLRKHPDEYMRTSDFFKDFLTEFFSKYPPKPASLVEALKDKSHRIRLEALRELGLIGGLEHIETISKMLNDRSVREEAKIAINNITVLKKAENLNFNIFEFLL